MKHINHIFFDLDHTLWDFEANSGIAFKTIFKAHDVAVELEKFLINYRKINQYYWKLYREEKIKKSDLRYGRLKDTFDLINYEASDALIENLAHHYIEVLPNSNILFDGTHEILSHLKTNYNLHIITNGFNEVQYKKIEQSDLSQYFDKVITSEDAGVKKPNPGIFEFALNSINSRSDQCMMIGDNWEADIMGAIDFGFDAIYFNSEKNAVGNGVKSVEHLLEIKQYL
jgi:putative hydrolase of the HAD superfamily